MSDYDAAFAAATAPKTAAPDAYDKVFASIAPQAAPAASVAPAKPQGGFGADVADVTNAVGTGYTKGLVRLAGLPMDTVVNAVNLGKAALGTPFLLAGKTPPKALEVTPNSEVGLTGDWMLDKLGQTKVGRTLTSPANPAYENGKAEAVGGGLTAVMAPTSGAQAVNQAVLGTSSALLGKYVGDTTGNPALAIAASMVPGGVQQYGTQAVKSMVRGNDGGANMRQRMQDLHNAGVENPTLGLASGNKVIGGVENILQNTPGAVNVMGRARDKAIAGLQGVTEESSRLASPSTGTFESGMAIQKGINQTFRDAFKAKQGQLYDRLEQTMGSQFPTKVDTTRAQLATLNEDIPGAPELSKFFKNSRIQALESAVNKDVAGDPPKPAVMSRIVQESGTPFVLQPEVPGNLGTGRLPFEAIKKARTLVGNEIADSTIVSSVPRSKWNALYGALSSDIQDAAQNAGPAATRAFNKANDHTRAGMERLDRIAPFGQMAAPEQAFTAMERAARENVSTLQAVKKSLPQDARGQVAGTVIERLGRAGSGQQNDTSTAWSPETFLTNWNKMTPKAREELFSGFQNAPEVKANVESVARATAMMRDASKMWANPSGTGANLTARATLGALGLGGGASAIGLLNPMVPVGVAGGLLGTNRLAAGLTNPKVVNAMSRDTYLSPQLLGAQLNSLVAPGLLSQ